jgi:uncharacterized protein (TIGR03437 family)
VKTATSKQVVLTWNGTAATYSVQRAPSGGAFSTIGTATTGTYTDTTIDPYTTYQYQVLAGTAASSAVTVGPPPSGLSNVAPAPLTGSTPSGDYGYNIALALDGNGDPAFSFIWNDPNADTDPADTSLMFRSWSRAKYAWNSVVKVATVGDVATSFRTVSSLAYDASTGAFALACETNGGESVVVMVSTDGGTTWSQKAVFKTTDLSTLGPSLALAGGNIYLAYVLDTEGLKYVTGKLSDNATNWQTKSAPQPTGTDIADYGASPSLALDSAGNPGIAYWAGDLSNDYNRILLFWKPASGAAPVRALDTQNQESDVAVKLAYYNLNPRIAVYALRLDSDYSLGLHFVRSDDGGISWQKVVLIPSDIGSSTDFPFDLALDSKGEGAIAFGRNTGSGQDVCGNPKLSRSTDLVTWTTCAIADVSVTGQFGPYPGAIQLAYGGNDKLFLLWWEQGDTQANAGVLMYREPPPNAVTTASITSVTDGGGFRSNIVAGSWVTIKGSNLADQSRTWSGSDFPSDNVSLPTSLSGVQVKINGLSAAVYYISPGQLNVQAPANISGSVSVQVLRSGAASNTVTAPAVQNAPGIFAYQAGTKTYPAALFNGTYTVVGDPSLSGSSVAKARAGDIIQLYASGLEASSAGVIVNAAAPTRNPVTCTIGSANAPVGFSGLVASGEFQINITVPSLADGEYPLTCSEAGQASQGGVVIPITH